MLDLFSGEAPWQEPLAPDAVILRRYACQQAEALIGQIRRITQHQPLVYLTTPGGYKMSVAMSYCGQYRWISDPQGYRYQSGEAEPLPEIFSRLAREAADKAGYSQFNPDSCLINRYLPGSKMSLHQDKNERDLTQPIVSVSLGLPAVFLFGGMARQDVPRKVMLEHGDVVVWGGVSRLSFHGILPVKAGHHPLTGALRYNLTFRRAG